MSVIHVGLAATVESRWWFHKKRTRVIAGNSSEAFSGLVLQTEAVIGIK